MSTLERVPKPRKSKKTAQMIRAENLGLRGCTIRRECRLFWQSCARAQPPHTTTSRPPEARPHTTKRSYCVIAPGEPIWRGCCRAVNARAFSDGACEKTGHRRRRLLRHGLGSTLLPFDTVRARSPSLPHHHSRWRQDLDFATSCVHIPAHAANASPARNARRYQSQSAGHATLPQHKLPIVAAGGDLISVS